MAKQIRLSKLLSCLLALSLVFSLAVPAFAADPAAPSAAPSRQILIVDGKEVDAEAYAIGGYNYFKLRDIAMLLSGTEVQFDVAADDDSHTILAETGKAHTPVGGELAEGADNSATCAVSDWKLSVDGTTVEASVYALGGNNYFKLRDLGTALGFGVDYDAEKDAAVITSTPVDPLALAVTPTSESFTLDGKTVKYDAYTNVLYVSKPYDVKLQSMNIFVPEGADEDTPIILKSGSGAYMAAEAKTPTGEADDIISQALAEGYVVISPAARGRNVTYKDAEGNDVFYGTGPANAVDLKAAIRYLRYNDAAIPGDCDKIIVDGTSASGAMGAILGTSGDSAAYEPYLEEIGAADTSDAVFAVMNFCPIVDLDNVEIAYEWMFGPYYDLEFYQDPACEADIVLSDIMAGYYPAYLNSLGLKDPETGKALTLDEKDIYSGSYMDYLLGYINDAATEYLSDMTADEIAAYLDSEDAQGRKISAWLSYDAKTKEATVTDFAGYVTGWYKSALKMKTVPSFNDIPGRHAGEPFYESLYSENSVFGTYEVQNRNFSNYLSQALTDAQAKGYWKDLDPKDYVVSDEVKALANMYNPMYWIANEDEDISTFAEHFYVRVGNKDHDTSQTIAVNYATALMNADHDVNFKMQWEQPHAGDYEMDEMFTWISEITKAK